MEPLKEPDQKGVADVLSAWGYFTGVLLLLELGDGYLILLEQEG